MHRATVAAPRLPPRDGERRGHRLPPVGTVALNLVMLAPIAQLLAALGGGFAVFGLHRMVFSRMTGNPRQPPQWAFLGAGIIFLLLGTALLFMR